MTAPGYIGHYLIVDNGVDPANAFQAYGITVRSRQTVQTISSLFHVDLLTYLISDIVASPGVDTIVQQYRAWPVLPQVIGLSERNYSSNEDDRRRIFDAYVGLRCNDTAHICFLGLPVQRPTSLTRITAQWEDYPVTGNAEKLYMYSNAALSSNAYAGEIVRDFRSVINPSLIYANDKPGAVRNLQKTFFGTQQNSTSCPAIPVDFQRVMDPAYASFYKTRCLPMLAKDLAGYEARLYGEANMADANDAIDYYCRVNNPNDPRCACYNGAPDPSGVYEFMFGTNQLTLPKDCWFVPCKDSLNFYNDFKSATPCSDLPTCLQVQTVVVENGGVFDKNTLTQSIACTEEGDGGGLGSIPPWVLWTVGGVAGAGLLLGLGALIFAIAKK